ncbi:MAG: hypothetical protein IT226_16480 [Flavobacteriales bacterium]|nr:hypothetical protein [Flavobacteriales bacterium]
MLLLLFRIRSFDPEPNGPNSMDLRRRLTLYLFGLIIGGGIAYWTYGERLTNGAWLPEAKVKSRLRSTLLATTPAVEEQLGARSLDLAAIRASMEDADVDFGASRRTDDSLIYSVTTKVNGTELHLVIGALRDFDKDTTATLLGLR